MVLHLQGDKCLLSHLVEHGASNFPDILFKLPTILLFERHCYQINIAGEGHT